MKKYLNIYCLMLPFLISILVYANSLQNSFVYDDESTIINNYFIRHWINLPNLFTSKYFSLSAELTYRPLVTLSYFFDYTFWHLNPTGYHLTNVLLHAINSTLVFVFVFQILKSRTTALTVALFFSSYPPFSEVVNAVGFREDLLACVFLILTFICYIKANQRRYILYYSLSLCCYLLSVFSKEMAITLPILIILYDFVFKKLSQGNEDQLFPMAKEDPSRRIKYVSLRSRILRYYQGYFFITVFYILSRFLFLHNPLEARISYPQNSIFVNFLTMPHVMASYVKLLFLPFNLNADHVVLFCTSLVKTSFWICLLFFAVIGIISFRLWSQRNYIFFFILWFFVTLIPVMNIIPLGNIMAERYLYIPGVGFCMIISILLSKKQIKHGFIPPKTLIHSTILYQKGIKKVFSHSIFILFFILAGDAYLTCRRNNDWKDGLWLWSKTILTSPDSFRAHINLGNAYEKKGFNSAALEEYKKALSIDPNDADVYNNLGIYYNKMNRFDEAIQYFIKCLNIKPQHARAYNNLGVVFTKQRRLDDAVQVFKKAISINPLYPDAHNNLGIAYYRKGLMKEAEREFKLAISIEPYHAEAHNDLGILYNDRHLFDDAIKEFEIAIQIKPNYANAHMNLGVLILKQRKDKNGTLFHLKESLRIDPLQEQADGMRKLIKKLENEST